MSHLTNSQVVQIDATIITGLIILMTLQSISPPFFQRQSEDVFGHIRDLTVEGDKLHSLVKEYCSPQINGTGQIEIGEPYYHQKCINWLDRFDELEKELDGWNNVGKQMGVLENNQTLAQSTKYAFNGLLFVNYITIFMILPFVVSAILGLTKKENQNKDNSASKVSIGFLIAGFIMIFIGLILIYGVMACSSPYIHTGCPRLA